VALKAIGKANLTWSPAVIIRRTGWGEDKGRRRGGGGGGRRRGRRGGK